MAGSWVSRLAVRRVFLTLLAGCGLVFPSALALAARYEPGEVVAFGKNGEGELGVGFQDKWETSPITVAGLQNVVELAQGFKSTLALLEDGKVESWGINNRGQLGDGVEHGEERAETEEEEAIGGRRSPGPVIDLEGVIAVAAAGDHSMALTSSGTVWTWGITQAGELGTGRQGLGYSYKATPQEVTMPEHRKAIAIAAGGASDYALLEGGEMVSWGENKDGQLGYEKETPAEEEACLTSDRNSKASKEKQEENYEKWGEGRDLCPHICDTEGGLRACSIVPELVSADGSRVTKPELALKDIRAISAGEESTYALLENGHVMAWGDDGKGELGTTNSNTIVNTKPEEVDGLSEVDEIAAGNHLLLAREQGGKVYGTGDAKYGDLEGPGEAELCAAQTPCYRLPVALPNLGTAEAIAAGDNDSFVTVTGKVYAFGFNQYGKLGVGQTPEVEGDSGVSTPTQITGIGEAQQVAPSEYRTSVLLKGNIAPSPVFAVTPGISSLELRWTFPPAPEGWRIRWRVAGTKAWTTKEISRSAQSFVISPLKAEDYEVKLVEFGHSERGEDKEILAEATPEA